MQGTMQSIYHPSESRGKADHGWLKSRHTFSFANYFDPRRINFGVLRVINDDHVLGGEGFGTHPHKDMEIISIPLEGKLQHRDSMRNGSVIRKGEVQVMSAGTGVTHSEFNADKVDPVKFLQIWVFPRELNLTPRYDQIEIGDLKLNEYTQLLSPSKEDAGTWINQDAWFTMAKWEKGFSNDYQIKKEGNGVYIFLISGKLKVGDQIVDTRDGYGVWDTDKVNIEALEDSEILFMDVPMELPSFLMRR